MVIVQQKWKKLVVASLAGMMTAVFSMNLVGDGLRDALDPKLKD